MARHKLSQRQIAAALGVSQPRVSHMAAAGMPTDDLAAALAWREGHIDPVLAAARRAGRHGAAAVPAPVAPTMPAPVAKVRQVTEVNGEIPHKTERTEANGQVVHKTERIAPSAAADYMMARARREAAEAAMRELDLAQQRGQCCDVRGTELAASAASRFLRDRVLGVVPQLAVELGGAVDTHGRIVMLTRALTRALQSVADVCQDPVEAEKRRPAAPADADRVH